jgi:hypothetical protein
VLELFTDALDKRDEDCPFYNSVFYPSQSVVGPAQAFHDAKWLTKIRPILVDQNKIKAVVEEVGNGDNNSGYVNCVGGGANVDEFDIMLVIQFIL